MKLILGIMTIGVLTLGGLAAYLYLSNGRSSLTAIINPSSPPLALTSPTPVAVSGTDYVPVSPLPVGTPKATSEVQVKFNTETSFTPAEKVALAQRVIDPLVDYYAETQPGELVSLTLSLNTQASQATYPYQGQAVFKSGGQIGFLIAKSGSSVDWWFPECLGSCNFSAAYKAKYPEVVAKTGQ